MGSGVASALPPTSAPSRSGRLVAAPGTMRVCCRDPILLVVGSVDALGMDLVLLLRRRRTRSGALLFAVGRVQVVVLAVDIIEPEGCGTERSVVDVIHGEVLALSARRSARRSATDLRAVRQLYRATAMLLSSCFGVVLATRPPPSQRRCPQPHRVHRAGAASPISSWSEAAAPRSCCPSLSSPWRRTWAPW